MIKRRATYAGKRAGCMSSFLMLDIHPDTIQAHGDCTVVGSGCVCRLHKSNCTMTMDSTHTTMLQQQYVASKLFYKRMLHDRLCITSIQWLSIRDQVFMMMTMMMMMMMLMILIIGQLLLLEIFTTRFCLCYSVLILILVIQSMFSDAYDISLARRPMVYKMKTDLYYVAVTSKTMVTRDTIGVIVHQLVHCRSQSATYTNAEAEEMS